MRFARTSEQQDMAQAVRDLLKASDVPSIARAWANGSADAWWAVWRTLSSMGVPGVVVSERHGGLGLGPVELAVCLEEIGYAGLPGPTVETLAAAPHLFTSTQDTATLARLVSGEALATVSFAEHGGWALDADRAHLRVACQGDRAVLAQGTISAPQPSFDAARHLFTVDSGRGEVLPAADVDAAFLQGALGCSAQLLGVGQRLLDLSVRHVRERHQFGRPIGEFQAVKHQLANVRVDVDFARPVLHGACVAWQNGGDHAARDISAAKVVTSEAAYRAARTALQVHGAIGYTAEHDLHLWLTKATALRTAWGTPSWHRRRVAQALAEYGTTVPIGGS